MATVSYTRPIEIDEVNRKVVKWVLTAATDEGEAYTFAGRYTDKNVQVIGTFAGDNLKMQGCNQKTPVNWKELHDSNETLLDTVAAEGFYQILENPVNFRPIKSAGTAAITVLLSMSK